MTQIDLTAEERKEMRCRICACLPCDCDRALAVAAKKVMGKCTWPKCGCYFTTILCDEELMLMERWLSPGGVVPVDVQTTSALVSEIKRLRSLITDHNAGCDQLCNNKQNCGYAGYKRSCPQCPKDWKIDL